LLSKINTCVQILYVILQLINLTTWFELPHVVVASAIYATAAVTVLSGLQYVAIWSAKAMHTRERAR
jgi:phosphatidylglycerophosphate synthase